ncbi:MAG: neutral/alkaline non-lysosomal ceramidase N-terminal domain-containing protein, partial [Acidobacteriota bacterium]
TPYGQQPDWDGTITDSGVWGERFTDQNGNHRWDMGEPFEDDPGNTELDASSAKKYDGVYLAGFGSRRLATGKHDDLWARTIVLDDGRTRFAIVSVDFIGYYSSASYYGISQVQKLVDPRLGIQEILVTSTHNHEGPDTIGAWGNGALSDGKYPKYLRFVDRQIARSIALASEGLTPVRLKLGRTDPRLSPSIAGMQTRTRGRPPSVFDEELRVMQFLKAPGSQGNSVVATLINWNTHPESMEDKNTEVTSDFPHTVRAEVEKRYGGTALYVSGAIGAVEIVGDSNTRSTDRATFDGKEFPLGSGNRPAYTFRRTEAIGRDISKAVLDAIGGAQWSRSSALELKKADLSGPMDNPGYALLSKVGVLDTISPVGDGQVPKFNTWIYALRIGDAQVVTTPGELLPELFLGLAGTRRADCPEADTGRPLEPGIRQHMSATHRFVFGLCPDELGYIVPGYDWRREPFDAQKMDLKPAVDACSAKGVPSHYHETNSASSILAPASTCVTVALLTGKKPTDKSCEDAHLYSDYVRRLSR